MKSMIDGKFYDEIVANNIVSAFHDNLRIYEVIRIIEGIPLFIEDHYNRLIASSKAKNISIFFTLKDFRKFLKEIIHENNTLNCNLMIECFFNEDTFHFYIFPRKHYYPKSSEYSKGVNLELIEIERPDPNVKLVDETYNELTNQAKSKPGIFEVLLVNKSGFITEASKANVFFIMGNQVVSPLSKQILMGVTRKHAIEAIGKAGISFIEKNVSINDLSICDGVFLTGTSLHLLPVAKVREKDFHTSENEVFIVAKKEFEKIVHHYLTEEGITFDKSEY